MFDKTCGFNILSTSLILQALADINLSVSILSTIELSCAAAGKIDISMEILDY